MRAMKRFQKHSRPNRWRHSMVTLICVGFFVPGLGATDTDWKQVRDEDGIRVSERAVAGQSLPEFMGVALLDSDSTAILAVIEDVDRHTEWMHDCAESRLLSEDGPAVRIVYNRTRTPWPISDRDVVLRSEKRVLEAEHLIEIRFQSIADEAQPEIRGVVRMPKMEGRYLLETTGPNQTRVEYSVNADPGGRLPKVIARSATRDIPFHTLRNLREQLARRSRPH